MQAILGIITGFTGMLGVIGSAISMRYWFITIIIMTILKLTGVVMMTWFAGPLTAGAISTGLWMLFGGLIMMGISLVVTVIGAVLIEK